MDSSTAKNTRINALDGLRGVACLMVFFYHSAVNLHIFDITVYGSVGVHIFFVLSGYLLYKQFIKKLVKENVFPSFYKFYMRRFFRIYPPYIIALAIIVLARY